MGRKPQDLTGRQFGLLTAMYPTEQRDKRGSVYWHSGEQVFLFECIVEKCRNSQKISIKRRYPQKNKELSTFST